MDGWQRILRSTGPSTRGLVGTVLTTVAAAVADAGLAGCDVATGPGSTQFADDRTESTAVTPVRLAGDDGSVTLRRGSDSGIQIHRQVCYRHDRPQQRADRVEGSILVLDTNCGRDCTFGYTVTLPSQVAVTGISRPDRST